MAKHRHPDVRPRYGRISVAGLSAVVTSIAVLGGVGALPSAADGPADDGRAAIAPAAQGSDAAGSGAPSGPRSTPADGQPGSPDASEAAQVARAVALPPRSGTGRRVVYSAGQQRVWLVAGGEVRRTYPVSGSIYDNLDPGTYSVFSRSEQAWGIDDSGTMRWFVRFAHGDNAAIGFHDIPVDDGARVQSVDQLGTPLSHGCIRQRRADAKALWDFAPVGTKVVVTA